MGVAPQSTPLSRRGASLDTGGLWTCPECARTFANTHQWHSCIELTLEEKLAEASGASRWVDLAGHELEVLGLGFGDAVDVGLRADL